MKPRLVYSWARKAWACESISPSYCAYGDSPYLAYMAWWNEVKW